MTVLVTIPCLLTGGTEIQTLNLVRALGDAGHRVVTVCLFEYAEAMVENYRGAGSEVVLLGCNGCRPKGIVAMVKFLWRGLRGIVKKYRPDVAHVQYMAPGALTVLALRAVGIKKIVATSHTFADIYSSAGLRIIRGLTATCLTAFQCITERAERSYFGSSRLFDGNLHKHFTIYNNIPPHIKMLDEPRRPLSADAPVTVGVVSRLERIKGMDLVVPAFARAFGRCPRLRLLVVGDGSQRQLMEQQAAKCGISDKAEFVGRQPQSALQSYYDRIDVLLMPSRSEGFGLTAIEGMARGCVPVVANVGGLPEVVTPESGRLHRPDDVADMASQISALASDLGLLANLSAGALRRAADFSYETYARNIATLYHELE